MKVSWSNASAGYRTPHLRAISICVDANFIHYFAFSDHHSALIEPSPQASNTSGSSASELSTVTASSSNDTDQNKADVSGSSQSLGEKNDNEGDSNGPSSSRVSSASDVSASFPCSATQSSSDDAGQNEDDTTTNSQSPVKQNDNVGELIGSSSAVVSDAAGSNEADGSAEEPHDSPISSSSSQPSPEDNDHDNQPIGPRPWRANDTSKKSAAPVALPPATPRTRDERTDYPNASSSSDILPTHSPLSPVAETCSSSQSQDAPNNDENRTSASGGGSSRDDPPTPPHSPILLTDDEILIESTDSDEDVIYVSSEQYGPPRTPSPADSEDESFYGFDNFDLQ